MPSTKSSSRLKTEIVGQGGMWYAFKVDAELRAFFLRSSLCRRGHGKDIFNFPYIFLLPITMWRILCLEGGEEEGENIPAGSGVRQTLALLLLLPSFIIIVGGAFFKGIMHIRPNIYPVRKEWPPAALARKGRFFFLYSIAKDWRVCEGLINELAES